MSNIEESDMRPLKEADIPNAMRGFLDACVGQFRVQGFELGDAVGDYQLDLPDKPILHKGDIRSGHGRCRLRGPDWAKAYWPHAESPGVYLLFNDDGRARYVGKAERSTGFRLGAHMGARGADFSYPHASFPEADYVIVIPFESASFLAPALESYLLENYDFPLNRNMKRAGAIREAEEGSPAGLSGDPMPE